MTDSSDRSAQVHNSIKSDKKWQKTYTICGAAIIALTIIIGIFLVYRGSESFTKGGHTLAEFLFSSEWQPLDSPGTFGGKIGSGIYIWGTIITCALGLLITLPFAIGAAIFLTEISPKLGKSLFRPAVEIYVGIPSVVYGWVGMTVLVPWIRDTFHATKGGYSVLAAAIVLAVMIFPTITTVSADAINSVSNDYREAAYGLGSTKWQCIHKVVIPAARSGIFVGVILGLARALGEALAVSMVIGNMRAFPADILSPTISLTTTIASDMGNTSNNGEYNLALWSMALLLFIISMLLIFLIHHISKKGAENA